MKLKYFMRGLGSGIIMTTLVLALGKVSPSDEDIMQRAKELGMVIESEESLVNNNVNQEEPEEVVKLEEVVKPEEAVKPEVTQEPDKVDELDEGLEKSQEQDKAEKDTELEAKAVLYKQVVITSGMYSHHVSILLEDNGIIEDAKEFDLFLIKNRYQSRIQTGTYSLSAQMSFKEIAQKITK